MTRRVAWKYVVRRENGLVFRARGASLSPVTNGVRSDPTAWTDDRHKRGLAGEEQAIQYLLSRGWHILAHRFRVGHKEIDLIARQGNLVAFVEVKARRGTAFGSPLEAVTGAKRRELVKAAARVGGSLRPPRRRLPLRLHRHHRQQVGAPGGRVPTRLAVARSSVYIRASGKEAPNPCRGHSCRLKREKPRGSPTSARRP